MPSCLTLFKNLHLICNLHWGHFIFSDTIRAVHRVWKLNWYNIFQPTLFNTSLALKAWLRKLHYLATPGEQFSRVYFRNLTDRNLFETTSCKNLLLLWKLCCGFTKLPTTLTEQFIYTLETLMKGIYISTNIVQNFICFGSFTEDTTLPTTLEQFI